MATKKTTTDEKTTVGEETTVDTPKAAKLTYAQKLAAMSDEDRAKARAKANEASRRSRAKRAGTTPEQAVIDRIKTRMAKNEQRRLDLLSDYAVLEEELKDAEAALDAAKVQVADAAGEEAGDVES